MPTIVREDHDNLNVTLTLTIPLADYQPEFKAQINKYRKDAHMKGFRKGKTPLSVVKKMYGKGTLVDLINKIVAEEIDKYLKEADFSILGQPIPSKDQEVYDFDLKELGDFVFKFDLGLAPEFDIQGLDGTFDRNDPIIPDSMIDTDLENAQKQLGEQGPVEDEIQDNDIVKLQADELEEGKIKSNGFANEFSVSVPEMTEAAKEIFKGKKKGDLVQFDIYNLSEGKDEQFVRKYFLDVNEDAEDDAVIGNDFQAVITEVTRAQPAELNQEFFDKFFGPDVVKTEEEAREKLKANIKKHFDRQGDALLFARIRETLEEKNPFVLPEEFLKRWMVSSGNISKDKNPDEEIDNLTKGLSWNLLRGKLAKRFDVKVEESEVKQALRMQMISYFGGQDFGTVLDGYVDKMMEDEQQYHNAYTQVLSDKVFLALKETITINQKEVSIEDLEALIKAENAKYQPEPEAVAETVTADEGIEEAEVIED